MSNADVKFNGRFYTVGGWTFDEDDKDLAYVDAALEAWSRWRDFVEEGERCS